MSNYNTGSHTGLGSGFGALFIPAGILLGSGLGAIWDQLAVGSLIGLGVGFLIFAITTYFRK